MSNTNDPNKTIPAQDEGKLAAEAAKQWYKDNPFMSLEYHANRRVRKVQEAAASLGFIYPNPDTIPELCPEGYIRVTITDAWQLHSQLVDGDYFVPRQRIEQILNSRRTKEERDDFFYEEDDLNLEDLEGPALGSDLKEEDD